VSTTVIRPFVDTTDHLRGELAALDQLLLLSLQIFHQYDGESGGHGWFLSRRQVENCLCPQPVNSDDVLTLQEDVQKAWKHVRARAEVAERSGRELCFVSVQRRFSLSPIERLGLLVCLAPELDGKYSRVYAYLQDDLTKRLPTLDLISRIATAMNGSRDLCWWPDDCPLLRWRLVQFAGEGEATSPRLSQGLVLNESVRRYLTALPEVSSEESTPLVVADTNLVHQIATLVRNTKRTVVVQLHGPGCDDAKALANSICLQLDMPLRGYLVGSKSAAALFHQAFLEARLHESAVFVSSLESFHDGPKSAEELHQLEMLVSQGPRLIFLVSRHSWCPQNCPPEVTFVACELPLPEYAERADYWNELLQSRQANPEPTAMAAVSARFRFSRQEMTQALRLAESQAALRNSTVTADDVAAACRRRARANFGSLATVIVPRQSWSSLVLPEEAIRQLREICAHVRQRARVLHDWGFDARLSLGKGLYVLFLGPSGTGKTLAAEVVAHELEVELLKVDLSSVVSKYIGETEKNLRQIFEGAERSDAILFFDEADALFGKRSEVKDAHDRYANIEINFLLQRLEEFEGVAILATNFAQNIDEAFGRRVHMTVEFPFPDEAARLAIWRNHIPRQTPVAPDLDLRPLARHLQITGGNIRNIVFNAAFLAAEEDGVVGLEHLLLATRREYQKIGKPYRDEDMPGFGNGSLVLRGEA
jgi:SpoVK/Ycf46/Vps4 family AAA+-type ATPase